MKKLGLIALTALLSACSGMQEDAMNNDLNTETKVVTVGSERVDCVGVAPMKCLVVDGSMFYNDIQGFEFESGYEYQLEIEKIQVYTKDNAPADASLYQYKLIKILDKTKA